MPNILSRAQGLGDVFKFLLSIDPSDIKAAIHFITQVSDTTKPVRHRVEAFLGLADLITPYIPGEVDDQIVDVLIDLSKSEQVWLFYEIVEDMFDGSDERMVSAMSSRPGGLILNQDGEEAKAIPWPLLIQVAMLLVDLFKTFNKEG